MQATSYEYDRARSALRPGGQVRRFHKLDESTRRRVLFSCLNNAFGDRYENRKTDLIGIACQYGGAYGVRREDFGPLLSMTVGELVAYFTQDGRERRKAGA
jgi:hypothetical protein